MFKEGELIKYMMPLDADYSYGVISIKKGRAEVILKSYPQGLVVDVPYRVMEHIRKR